MDPAAVFVIGEVAHVVEAVLDVPVLAHQREQLLGSRAVGSEGGEAVGHLDAAPAGLEDVALALDAQGLAAAVEVGVAVLLGPGEIDYGATPALDAAMALVHGLMTRGVCEVWTALRSLEDGLLVVLDVDHVVGASPA
ncbi:MAG: hypothetical protein OXU75_02210 [Deltaproteobacteria bacterium]|nr:hypothetical protein [Deltaproteobacteria bacterium]